MKILLVVTMLLITSVCQAATVFTAREVLTAAKLNTALAEKASLGTSVDFSSVTAGSITVPQGVAPQQIELAVSAATGSSVLIIRPLDNIGANIILEVGAAGLYKNGVLVLPW